MGRFRGWDMGIWYTDEVQMDLITVVGYATGLVCYTASTVDEEING